MHLAQLLILIFGACLVQGQQSCPGYTASNVQQSGTGLTADLTLAGDACNVYGLDLPNLTLTVEYQSGQSIGMVMNQLTTNSEPATCSHRGPKSDCLSGSK